MPLIRLDEGLEGAFGRTSQPQSRIAQPRRVLVKLKDPRCGFCKRLHRPLHVVPDLKALDRNTSLANIGFGNIG